MANILFHLLFLCFTVCFCREVSNFFHISDFHYDPCYNASLNATTFCRSNFPKLSKKVIWQGNAVYGQYGCDSPAQLVQEA